MPVACPKCGRPNPDASPKCAYCKSSLDGGKKLEVSQKTKFLAEQFLKDRSPAQPGGPATKAPGAPRAKHSDTPKKLSDPTSPHAKPKLSLIRGGKQKIEEKPKKFWIIVAPGQSGDKQLIKSFSQVAGIDVFRAKNTIGSSAPWILKKFEEAAAAKELADKLRDIGLDVYTLDADELRSFGKTVVGKLTIGERSAVFYDVDSNEPAEVGFDDIALIVTGRICTMPIEDRGVKKKKDSQKNESPPSRLKNYEVADLYSKSGRRVRIEIGTTDFSGLGEYKTPSSLLNLKWVLDRFTEESNPQIDDNYRKMKMDYRPLADEKSAAQSRFMDNSKHFDEYSLLAYLNCAKTGGKN